MRVPLSWLREHCLTDLPTAAIVERFDLSGTEVARVERFGPPSPEGFVIGKVLKAEQHPDADRLKVCQVDAGGGERTIVCGAPNVAAGQTVAVALPGAVMPDGTKLGEAKLRGVKSSGMILAEDELGIGEDHAGIMVLDDGPAPGTPLTELIPVSEDVLELEITPNRPDCLSVLGVALELSAAAGGELVAPEEEELASEPPSTVPIDIDPEVCRRFTAVAYEDVTIGPSPPWLKARLSAAGQRPISNVVDITNYVMLLTGQPMHAFDTDEIRGGRIDVRRAKPGEKITTLDDVERELTTDMAVVCDAEGPSGIAGIMGGQISEVSEKTTRVLMEAATWVGPNVLETSKKLALRTEASTRFEKTLHPFVAHEAQQVTAVLMKELAGARIVGGMADVYPDPPPKRIVVLRLARVTRLLGKEIPAEEVRSILASLGFGLEESAEGFDVTVPGFRDADVQREADLIEEIARIHGLEKLPTTLPARREAIGRMSPERRLRRRVEDALRDRGLDEIVGWSFTAPATLVKLRLGDAPALALANPLSEDHSVMRPLLLPGLLDAARHNLAHGADGVQLYESAHVYAPEGDLIAPEGSPEGAVPAAEEHHLGALITVAVPATWRTPPRPADFYAAKGLVEAVLAAAGIPWVAEPAPLPYLHPARAARVVSGDVELGWIGELHPLVAREWDLEGGAAFELDLDAIARLLPPSAEYATVPAFPAVAQDLAVVVAEDTPSAMVEQAVRDAAGELLQSVVPFDVYRGEQIGAEEKSIAYRLRFRSTDRTLTDEEVEALRAQIATALEGIGGRIR
ncbi:MAG: phenylalanine--tRNA ligase subunit beta [Thermoleophilaceae bacterium]|nr:phenylalanine--tRNA ligase subunit beta [Thermoleophilaceae bacterium]